MHFYIIELRKEVEEKLLLTIIFDSKLLGVDG